MCIFYAYLVNIAVTPQIMFTASPPRVPVGESTLLTCTITAVPAANFAEIVRILPSEEEEVVANASNPMGDREFQVEYRLKNMRFSRDNGAVFRYRATNANGEQVQDLTIIVKGELYVE